jgi:hypothetical protein
MSPRIEMAQHMSKQSKHRSKVPYQYSERPIANRKDLYDFIDALDEDEGIRICGKLKNHAGGGFVFIGYYRGSYCVNICDRIWNSRLRKYVAGGKDEWYYFDTMSQAYTFALKQAKLPIQAWLY